MRPRKRARSDSPIEKLEQDFLGRSLYQQPPQEVIVRYRRKVTLPKRNSPTNRPDAGPAKLRQDTPYPRAQLAQLARIEETPTKARGSSSYPPPHVTVETFDPRVKHAQGASQPVSKQAFYFVY